MNADLNALWRTIYGEAEPGDEKDAIAIGWVVLNRAAYPNWPDTLRGVCYQPWQFSCWNADNPRLEHLNEVMPDHSAWTRKCHRIAEDLMAGRIEDPTKGSTHYYATYIKAPKWAKGKTPVYQTAGGKYTHLFFNNIDTPPPQSAKEALDQIRPLRYSREITGAVVAAVGTVASNAGEIRDVVAGQADNLTLLGVPASWIAVALAVLGVLGAAWVIRARVQRRKEGLS